jgi:hypothetical protein
MQATIRHPDAQRVVVLSIGQFLMRVAPRDAEDAVELTLQYGQWTDESGMPIEFESFVVDDENDFRMLYMLRERSEVRSAAS